MRLVRNRGENMRTIVTPIFTLRPYERGIQETLGKYTRFVLPGLGVQWPFAQLVRVRDIREHTIPWTSCPNP